MTVPNKKEPGLALFYLEGGTCGACTAFDGYVFACAAIHDG
jgi:hypothetical protein